MMKYSGIWLLWLLVFMALAFGFRGFLLLPYEGKKEIRKAGRKQGRGLLRRVTYGF